eukprot:9617614-Lingulodinium_polyedra.AAC.1
MCTAMLSNAPFAVSAGHNCTPRVRAVRAAFQCARVARACAAHFASLRQTARLTCAAFSKRCAAMRSNARVA